MRGSEKRSVWWSRVADRFGKPQLRRLGLRRSQAREPRRPRPPLSRSGRLLDRWPGRLRLPWLRPRWDSHSRFEPGPLGLLGVMLSAMAVTLLLIQTGSGGGAAEDGRTEEPVTVPGPPDGELRVMVVGDSLSQGSSGDYTWRYHLWSHLREAEVEVDFVGPYDGVYGLADREFGNQDYADPDFDTDHAARWGTTAQDLSAGAARVAAEYQPHYLLLLAGTEDILAGDDADSALEGVGETVSTVRVVRGQTRFVLGELPPVEDPRANAEIDRFNMGLVDLAAQLTSSDSPVVVARIADGYASVNDNWDEAHPNARGELKIAAAFADALAEPLGVGRTYRRPLPDLAVGPATAPEPVAEESDDGLVLSWDAVPGATGYRVVQRRMGPDPDEAAVLPVDVRVDGDSRSVLVEALFSGARYEFVVRSFKGRDEGAESEPLQWVWDDDPPPGPSWLRVVDGGATVEWEDVEEASHYEVWVRALDCGVADDRRVPVPEGRFAPAADRGRHAFPALDRRVPVDGGPYAPLEGDRASEAPVESPAPSSGPSDPEPDAGPRPQPTPAPTPAPTPSEPEPGPVAPAPDCERRDGLGPGDGQGWRTLGPAGEEPRWSATVSGPYELVVRSYRDYVEGGYSDSVLLAGG
ncbi:fibronectin type III domain-containing protein [Nocardiopsis deserti]|uniref:fibronectin type III domain-containing protein n=1 Tax=Nocardiopsis deserti TaxID=2605988 RepID=UPI00123BD847